MLVSLDQLFHARNSVSVANNQQLCVISSCIISSFIISSVSVAPYVQVHLISSVSLALSLLCRLQQLHINRCCTRSFLSIGPVLVALQQLLFNSLQLVTLQLQLQISGLLLNAFYQKFKYDLLAQYWLLLVSSSISVTPLSIVCIRTSTFVTLCQYLVSVAFYQQPCISSLVSVALYRQPCISSLVSVALHQQLPINRFLREDQYQQLCINRYVSFALYLQPRISSSVSRSVWEAPYGKILLRRYALYQKFCISSCLSLCWYQYLHISRNVINSLIIVAPYQYLYLYQYLCISRSVSVAPYLQPSISSSL